MPNSTYTGSNPIPANKYGVIKVVKCITSSNHPTYNDLNYTISLFESLIQDGLSAEEINIKLNLGYKKGSFAAVLRNCFGIKLKSNREAVRNYYRKTGRSITDEKKRYFKDASFKFKTIDYRTPGFELLETYKFLPGHLQGKEPHLNRDHMVSVKYGWDNKIDPNIISHPANCHLILARDNQRKGSNCSISLDSLLNRISIW